MYHGYCPSKLDNFLTLKTPTLVSYTDCMSGYSENMLLPIPKTHACLVTNIPSHIARLPCSYNAGACTSLFMIRCVISLGLIQHSVCMTM